MWKARPLSLKQRTLLTDQGRRNYWTHLPRLTHLSTMMLAILTLMRTSRSPSTRSTQTPTARKPGSKRESFLATCWPNLSLTAESSTVAPTPYSATSVLPPAFSLSEVLSAPISVPVASEEAAQNEVNSRKFTANYFASTKCTEHFFIFIPVE